MVPQDAVQVEARLAVNCWVCASFSATLPGVMARAVVEGEAMRS